MNRSTTSSRWAPPQSSVVPRLVVPEPSSSHTSYNTSLDEDIDMGDISPAAYSHKSPSVGFVYRRLAEDPLENFIKNLQYDDVLSRGAGYVSNAHLLIDHTMPLANTFVILEQYHIPKHLVKLCQEYRVPYLLRFYILCPSVESLDTVRVGSGCGVEGML